MWQYKWPQLSQALRRTKMWHISFLSLLVSGNLRLVDSMRCHCDHFFGNGSTGEDTMIYLVINMWSSIRDSNVKSPCPLHCNESLNGVTMRSRSDSQVTDILRLYYYMKSPRVLLHDIIRWLHFDVESSDEDTSKNKFRDSFNDVIATSPRDSA